MKTLLHQYELIKGSREVVLAYCEGMKPEHYTTQVENFGRGGTICHLQMHTINSYMHWLDYFALKQPMIYLTSDEIKTVADIRTAFEKVDRAVEKFLTAFDGKYFTPVTNIVPSLNKELTVDALTLFTHATTHEFHHKGQIMSMGRMLGYPPPDADLIRF